MGGRLEINNRETDRRNEAWLEAHGSAYPYRWTTKFGTDINPNMVKQEMGKHMMRVPFPGKSQVVWGFESAEDLDKFKRIFIHA